MVAVQYEGGELEFEGGEHERVIDAPTLNEILRSVQKLQSVDVPRLTTQVDDIEAFLHKRAKAAL